MFTALQLGPYKAKARMKAMAAGIVAAGGNVMDVNPATYADLRTRAEFASARFAFTCGLQPVLGFARGWLRGLGLPLLVLDCGYFRRANAPDDESGYNQLSLGGLCWVPPEPCPEARFAALDLPLAPLVAGRPKTVLILGQVPDDTQHRRDATQLADWLVERAAAWLARGYRLIYRPHPKAAWLRLPLPGETIAPAQEPLYISLSRAAVALTYNSTSGLEALMAGVPVECHASAHYAHLQPGTPALRDHCERLACAQWTCAELRTGAPLRFMHRFAPLLPAAEVPSLPSVPFIPSPERSAAR